MKKSLKAAALVLAAVMLTGCGSKADTNQANDTAVSAQPQKTEESATADKESAADIQETAPEAGDTLTFGQMQNFRLLSMWRAAV